MSKIDDILGKPGDEPIDDGKLLRYLQGNLSKEEQHELEKSMADSPFVNDAVEGLQQVTNPAALNDYVKSLNQNLHKQLASRNKHKEKRKIKGLSWIITAVVILLLLCLAGYAVLQMLQHQD